MDRFSMSLDEIRHGRINRQTHDALVCECARLEFGIEGASADDVQRQCVEKHPELYEGDVNVEEKIVDGDVKQVYSTGEAAKLLQVAPRTVSKWFDHGKLKGYRIPGSHDRRIPREQLIRFMKDNNFPVPTELASE